MFNVGDTVVKPGLGICKIKAVRNMQVEGKNQQFYVLQSGDVKVMVPFSYAHAGGLRLPLDADGIEKIYAYLREPIPVPENEHETPELYPVALEKGKEEIKQRDPQTVAALIKTLFYKEKLVELAKAENELYHNALSLLGDEIAHYEHSTRLKAVNRIKAVLTEGRRSRNKESLMPH